ncbi:LacI family DNA-binding transcriptional regulator [Labrys neptuniae]
MADVARLAGVSLNTVSLAINDPKRVAEKTRLKVAHAIEQSGYVPNKLAGALAARRSNIVVSIIPTMITKIYADYTEGLTEELEKDAFQVLIGSTDYDLEREADLLRTFAQYRPAAVVVAGLTHSDRGSALLQAFEVPVIETLNLSPSAPGATVGFSNFQAIFDLTQRLIDKGRRKLAYVSTRFSANDRYRDRLAGFKAATEQAGLAAETIYMADYAYEAGAQALAVIRQATPTVDGVVFSTDIPAIGALMKATQLGIRVPEDIAITALGDPELASFLTPGLTAAHIDYREIGRRTGALIRRHAAGEIIGKDTRIDVGYTLMARASG